MTRPRRMSDCYDLIENQIGWDKLSRAIDFIDKNYGGKFSKHQEDMYRRIQDTRYLHDETFIAETAGMDYEFLAKHIKIYKTESPDFNKAAADLFDKLGWNEKSKETEEQS